MSLENVPAKWRFLIKKPRKRPEKKKTEGLSTRELILRAVNVGKDRNGFSYAALTKAMAAAGYDVEGKRHHLKSSIRSLLSSGDLILYKGSTFSGSYKLSKAAEAALKVRCREEANVNFAAMEAAAAEKAAAAAAEQKAPAAAETDREAADIKQEVVVVGKEATETEEEAAAAVMESPKNT